MIIQDLNSQDLEKDRQTDLYDLINEVGHDLKLADESDSNQDPLSVALDAIYSNNEPSTGDLNHSSSQDHHSLSDQENQDLDHEVDVVRHAAQETLQKSFPSRKVHLPSDIMMNFQCGLFCLPASTYLFDLRQLSERVGHNCSDVKVKQSGKNGKFRIEIFGTKIYKASLNKLLSDAFINTLITDLVPSKKTKIKKAKLATSVLACVGESFNTQSNLKVSAPFDSQLHLVSERTFTRWLNDDRMVEFFRVYATILTQAIEIINSQNDSYEMNKGPAMKALINGLRSAGISDVVATDGSQIGVNNSIRDSTNVNGSGKNRYGEWPDGHKWTGTSLFNSMIKLHLEGSILSNSICAATITEGTATEYQQVDTKRLSSQHENKLFIADRGYHAILQIARALRDNCKFIIRINTTSAYEIVKAHTADGHDLQTLVGKPLNSKLVADAAEKYKLLELVVKPKGMVSRGSITDSDWTFFTEKQAASKAKKLAISTDECRVVVISRATANVPEKDKLMFLLTNVDKSKLNAKCIKTLYSLRWKVEIMFKSLKQGCFLKKCNSRNINPALIYLYASLICFQIKTLLYNRASELCLIDDYDDDIGFGFESVDAIYEHLMAALAGITRKSMELINCLQFFKSRSKSRDENTKCVLTALNTDRPFANKYNAGDYVTPILPGRFIVFLRQDDGLPFRHLLHQKRSETIETVIAAANGDIGALSMFASLDQSLRAHGMVCNTVGVINMIAEKATEIGVSVENAIHAPKLNPSISLLRTMTGKVSANAITELFKNGKDESHVQDILSRAAKDISRTCQSSHKPLKVYERCKDAYLQQIMIAHEFGYNDSLQEQVLLAAIGSDKAIA